MVVDKHEKNESIAQSRLTARQSKDDATVRWRLMAVDGFTCRMRCSRLQIITVRSRLTVTHAKPLPTAETWNGSIAVDSHPCMEGDAKCNSPAVVVEENRFVSAASIGGTTEL